MTTATATCAECGSPFERERRRERPVLTCSPTCKARRTARVAGERLVRTADQITVDCCPTCGSEREHWHPQPQQQQQTNQYLKTAIDAQLASVLRFRANARDAEEYARFDAEVRRLSSLAAA